MNQSLEGKCRRYTDKKYFDNHPIYGEKYGEKAMKNHSKHHTTICNLYTSVFGEPPDMMDK